MTSKIASRVIAKMGGAVAVADILGLDQSAVHRWTYPRGPRRGRGGIVPARHQQPLLEAAREKGIDLRPEDFFDEGDEEGDEEGRAA